MVRYGASAVCHAQQAPEVPLSPWRVFMLMQMLSENTCMILRHHPGRNPSRHATLNVRRVRDKLSALNHQTGGSEPVIQNDRQW